MNKTFVRNLTIAFLCFVPVWMFACKDVKFSEQKSGIGSQTYMELNNRRQVYG